tara:strand:- start:634 stop:3489 length:2856 start_codon:yes stop_codon:yes gene_type:complete
MGLNSTSVIKILDLLCEGPIDGIEGGREGVFLDETPLNTNNGDANISKELVTHEFTPGSRNQPILSGAGAKTSITQNVSQVFGNTDPETGEFVSSYKEHLAKDSTTGESLDRVKSRNYAAGELVVRVTDTETDSVDLIFTIPRLFSTAQEGLVKGQLFDAVIFFDIAIKNKNQSKFNKILKTDASMVSEDFKVDGNENLFFIEGQSTSGYQYKVSGIELDGEGPWDIRVRKYPFKKFQGIIPHSQEATDNQESAGEIDSKIFRATFNEFKEKDKQTPIQGRANTLIWSAITKNFDVKLGYNYSALVSMNISTEEFQSLPTRAYLVRGRKVRIPKGATAQPEGHLTFANNFDGQLGDRVFTTCPVCIFYDLLINRRYGCGHFIDATNLSWVDLYPLCQYANELITLEDGTQEPRFACNVQVSSQQEAFTVLQDFASIFRGMMYWQSNTIQVTADHGNLRGNNGVAPDVDPVHIFSNSNVIGGVFNYSGSSLKTRSTSIKIRYSDPDNFYKPNIVCIEDPVLITKYGYQVKEILAFGCTSKTQAQRLGRWMMKSEELDANTVTFAVGLDGVLVFPGQVFAIQDELRAGTRLSGRINSSSGDTQIIADQPITLPSGGDPKLTCVLTNGNVESRDIASVGDGVSTNITVTTAFSSEPLSGSIYSISTNTTKEQKFRCLSVADNGDGTYAVVAVQFNDSIYAAADSPDNTLQFDDITVLDKRPKAPVISIDFQRIEKNGNVTNRAFVSWTREGDGFSASFDARYRIEKGDFNKFETTSTSFVIDDNLKEGDKVEVQVRAIGVAGTPLKKSKYARATANVPDPSKTISGDESKATEEDVPNVRNLTCSRADNGLLLIKFRSPKAQRNNNFTVLIRYSPKTSENATFANSTKVTAVSGGTEEAVVELQSGTYLIKMKDNTTKKKSNTTVKAEIIFKDESKKKRVTQIIANANIATTGA